MTPSPHMYSGGTKEHGRKGLGMPWPCSSLEGSVPWFPIFLMTQTEMTQSLKVTFLSMRTFSNFCFFYPEKTWDLALDQWQIPKLGSWWLGQAPSRAPGPGQSQLRKTRVFSAFKWGVGLRGYQLHRVAVKSGSHVKG